MIYNNPEDPSREHIYHSALLLSLRLWLPLRSMGKTSPRPHHTKTHPQDQAHTGHNDGHHDPVPPVTLPQLQTLPVSCHRGPVQGRLRRTSPPMDALWPRCQDCCCSTPCARAAKRPAHIASTAPGWRSATTPACQASSGVQGACRPWSNRNGVVLRLQDACGHQQQGPADGRAVLTRQHR